MKMKMSKEEFDEYKNEFISNVFPEEQKSMVEEIIFFREELYTGIGDITFKNDYGETESIDSHIGDYVIDYDGEKTILIHIIGTTDNDVFCPQVLMGYAKLDDWKAYNAKLGESFLGEASWICSSSECVNQSSSNVLWIPELNLQPQGESFSIRNAGLRSGALRNEHIMSNIKTEDIDKIPGFLIPTIEGITKDNRLDTYPLNVRENHFIYIYDDIPESINDTNLDEHIYIFTRGNQYDGKDVHRSYGKNYSIKLSLKTSDSINSRRSIDYKSVIDNLLNIHADRKEFYDYKAEVANQNVSKNIKNKP